MGEGSAARYAAQRRAKFPSAAAAGKGAEAHEMQPGEVFGTQFFEWPLPLLVQVLVAGPFNILPRHIKNLIPPTMSWVNQ